jgi:hypothetical protein
LISFDIPLVLITAQLILVNGREGSGKNPKSERRTPAQVISSGGFKRA